MKTSPKGRSLIEQREGVRLAAYQDSVGVWTIGVGHTSAAGAPHVVPGLRITPQEADQILSQDLEGTEACVGRAVHVELSDHEFDACVSLAFNIGGGNFTGSTLVRKLNAGDRAGAANAFLGWTKAGGHLLPGLVNRRKSERQQFLTPYGG